ncbi:MAG: RNA-binding protein [Candidatus Pacebacteria bacterium]|nr:RNA-binding protein [Candidatus Paceibacterota bacterium]
MAYKLYIAGLPYSATEQDLSGHFGQAGTVVSSIIIRDKMNQDRSRGFGFVEMDNEAEGQKAIEMFDGKDFGGRSISVSVARPRE